MRRTSKVAGPVCSSGTRRHGAVVGGQQRSKVRVLGLSLFWEGGDGMGVREPRIRSICCSRSWGLPCSGARRAALSASPWRLQPLICWMPSAGGGTRRRWLAKRQKEEQNEERETERPKATMGSKLIRVSVFPGPRQSSCKRQWGQLLVAKTQTAFHLYALCILYALPSEQLSDSTDCHLD